MSDIRYFRDKIFGDVFAVGDVVVQFDLDYPELGWKNKDRLWKPEEVTTSEVFEEVSVEDVVYLDLDPNEAVAAARG